MCSDRYYEACDGSNSQPTSIAMQSNKFLGLYWSSTCFFYGSCHYDLKLPELCSTVAGNGRYTAKNESVHLFAAKIGNSYSCKNESLFMGNGLYLDVTQSQMQAFNLTKSGEFGRRKGLLEYKFHRELFGSVRPPYQYTFLSLKCIVRSINKIFSSQSLNK